MIVPVLGCSLADCPALTLAAKPRRARTVNKQLLNFWYVVLLWFVLGANNRYSTTISGTFRLGLKRKMCSIAHKLCQPTKARYAHSLPGRPIYAILRIAAFALPMTFWWLGTLNERRNQRHLERYFTKRR